MHADQKYIDALLNNDIKLLKELYKKCFPVVRQMVLQNNGTEINAADIFQDSLIELFKKVKAGQFVLTFSVCAYVKGICRNKWNDELKKRKLEGVTFTDFEGQDDIREDSFMILEEQQLSQTRLNLLRKKFNELSESCKALLHMSWTKNSSGEKRSTEDVAKLLNLSDGYVRKKKSDCIVKLIKLVMDDPEYQNLK